MDKIDSLTNYINVFFKSCEDKELVKNVIEERTNRFFLKYSTGCISNDHEKEKSLKKKLTPENLTEDYDALVENKDSDQMEDLYIFINLFGPFPKEYKDIIEKIQNTHLREWNGDFIKNKVINKRTCKVIKTHTKLGKVLLITGFYDEYNNKAWLQYCNYITK